jgi:hypothetical protein
MGIDDRIFGPVNLAREEPPPQMFCALLLSTLAIPPTRFI